MTEVMNDTRLPDLPLLQFTVATGVED